MTQDVYMGPEGGGSRCGVGFGGTDGVSFEADGNRLVTASGCRSVRGRLPIMGLARTFGAPRGNRTPNPLIMET